AFIQVIRRSLEALTSRGGDRVSSQLHWARLGRPDRGGIVFPLGPAVLGGCGILPPPRFRSADVLPVDGARGGRQGAQRPRTRPAGPLEPDGGGAAGRAHADRRVPPRRPRAAAVPADA